MERMKVTIKPKILLLVCACSITLHAQTAFLGIRNITALELTADMAPGVNLTNTLDAYCSSDGGLGSETCWGKPETKKEMITEIRKRGFRTLRLPVTWFNHMGSAPDYTIDTAWMDRVEEVANYAFDNNMYVIINIHHDDLSDKEGTWLIPTYENEAACSDQLKKVWTQIANRFKDYGDYLIFETLNEPRAKGSPDEWNGGSAEHRDVVNTFNEVAVNAIRATGGNNASRFIMIPQVGAHATAAIESLIFPNNDPKIIVSIHNYSPYSFSLKSDGAHTWGSASEIQTLQSQIESYYEAFIKNGRAVIISEWGVGANKDSTSRISYYETYANAAKENQVATINWIYSFDRSTLTWTDPDLDEAVLNAFGRSPVTCYNEISRIEAENYIIMDGVKIENSSEGGANVGFIGDNDYMVYCLEVTEDSHVQLNARVASKNGDGHADILIDDKTVASFNVDPTGGWQTWETVNSGGFNLSQGEYQLKVNVTSGKFNLNWLEFTDEVLQSSSDKVVLSSSDEVLLSSSDEIIESSGNHVLSSSSVVSSSISSSSPVSSSIVAADETAPISTNMYGLHARNVVAISNIGTATATISIPENVIRYTLYTVKGEIIRTESIVSQHSIEIGHNVPRGLLIIQFE